MYVDEKFLGVTSTFPKHDINPDKKGKEWCMLWLKAIYTNYLNNKTGIYFNSRSRFYELRQYAEGAQNPNKYKEWLIGKGQPQEKARKGFMNVNFDDIFSPAPAYIQTIVGKFEDLEHMISVDALDPKSGEERRREKNKARFRMEFKPQLEQIEQAIGVQKPQGEYQPETMAELELYDSMGGFKQRYELAMEEAIRSSFDISDWQETKRKLIKDFLTCGSAATMDYVDPDTQRVKTRYIDILDVIIEYSHWSNFENSRFGAVVIPYTVEELRHETDIPEDDLERLAHQYCGIYDNPDVSAWQRYTGTLTDGTYKYSSFRIPVLYGAWKTVNNLYKTERTNKRGDTMVYKEKYGKVWDSEQKKTTVNNVRMVYHGKWIIGTDYCWDFGPMKDIPRPKVNDVSLPFHVYRLTGKSFIETIKKSLDTIHITKLKLEAALAKAPPNGIAVEYGSLEGLTFGTQKMEPMDLIQMRYQTGDIIYRAQPLMGAVNQGYLNSKPIQELAGGIGVFLNECITIFETEFNFIARLTGIDRMTLNSVSPNVDTAAKTIQLATASTDNALKPMYAGYMWIKQDNAQNFASRIQTICMFNKDKDKGFYDVIGEAGVRAIKEAGDSRFVRWGITITPKPTEEMKLRIQNAAEKAMSVGKNGVPLLDFSDYLFIQRVLANNNLKYAEAYLNYKTQLKQKQIDDNMQKNTELQGQMAQQVEQVKLQGVVAKIQTEYDNKIRFEQAKAEIEVMKERQLTEIRDAADVQKHGRSMELESHKATLDVQKPQAQKQLEMDFNGEEIQPPV